MCSHLFRSKRVGPLLSGLAFAILVAGSATAADFSRRSAKHSDAEFKRFVAERQQVSATSADARKKLFDEFLAWRAVHERH